jgi:hypothetical protein
MPYLDPYLPNYLAKLKKHAVRGGVKPMKPAEGSIDAMGHLRILVEPKKPIKLAGTVLC